MCKFLEFEVQIPVGSLARPVTADHTHYHTRYDKYSNDYEGSLHHASVPLVCPRYSAIAIALMNTPAMMYTKSI